MKVMVLGCNGLLGHKLYQVLGGRFDVIGTMRGTFADIERYGFFRPARVIGGVDATRLETVISAIKIASPDAVINCIGIVKALAEKSGTLMNIWVNSLFPHQLFQVCQAGGIKLIHISTDCVFSGKKGGYTEDDLADACDLYGRTKYLGEVAGPGALVLRTSFFGRELAAAHGLLEWFIGNRGGAVTGYAGAIFSGLPTLHLAGIIADVLEKQADLGGLYHVSAPPISKYDLLTLINQAMGLNINVNRSDDFRYDRSLDSARFRRETGFSPPPWEVMVAEMAADAGQYSNWR